MMPKTRLQPTLYVPNKQQGAGGLRPNIQNLAALTYLTGQCDLQHPAEQQQNSCSLQKLAC